MIVNVNLLVLLLLSLVKGDIFGMNSITKLVLVGLILNRGDLIRRPRALLGYTLLRWLVWLLKQDQKKEEKKNWQARPKFRTGKRWKVQVSFNFTSIARTLIMSHRNTFSLLLQQFKTNITKNIKKKRKCTKLVERPRSNYLLAYPLSLITSILPFHQ